MDRDDLRVGDAERDETSRALRDHWALGRLTIEELDRRLDSVYAAATRSELRAGTSDLPEADVPLERAQARSLPRFFWPGVTAFHEERHHSASCQSAFATALREIVPRMGTQGFHSVDELWPRRLRFVSDSGLFLTVMFHPAADGGTNVSAFGHPPRSIRKAFATLRD
jgi:Domain of unknown function (DUF1707)